ncbi:hypothetical protein HYDPIDRAFT_24715 [Hydnomerulius pinastri MD-312]|nr:hypothetical protein HYDPIDRAFT_24715 [Hydnomerulius pinastri MD-312]
MPSIVRAVFVVAPIAALAVLLGTPFTAQQALAKPMPLSRIRAYDSELLGGVKTIRYARAPAPQTGTPPVGIPHGGQAAAIPPPQGQPPQTPKGPRSKGKAPKGHAPKSKAPKGQPARGHPPSSGLPPQGQSQAMSPSRITGAKPPGGAQKGAEQQIATLKQQHQAAAQSAAQFHQVATEPNVQGNPAYQAQAANSLSEFHGNMLGAQQTFSELAAGKGQANFDPSSEVEVIMKDLANLNKQVLDDVVALVSKIPVLGPILAPIVQQIKCIIVDLIDDCTNFLDSVLNTLKPLVEPLLPGIL